MVKKKFVSDFISIFRLQICPQMNDQELFYLLALQAVDGVGDIIAKKLLMHFGSAEAVFKAKTTQLAAIEGIGTILLKNLKDQSVFAKAERELQFIASRQLTVTSYQDTKYPERLKHCFDSPLVLFSSGNIDLQNQKTMTTDWKHTTNIYEVNVRQFSKEGTFKAVEKELPRLKRMGVETLWFMPITPIAQKNKKGVP